MIDLAADALITDLDAESRSVTLRIVEAKIDMVLTTTIKVDDDITPFRPGRSVRVEMHDEDFRLVIDRYESLVEPEVGA